MGWPDAWFQPSLKWMAITRMGFYEFLFSVECRHIVFPEYKKFLIEIRLDRCRVVHAWTYQWKEVHHVLRKMEREQAGDRGVGESAEGGGQGD
jgi:hypothetical protein